MGNAAKQQIETEMKAMFANAGVRTSPFVTLEVGKRTVDEYSDMGMEARLLTRFGLYFVVSVKNANKLKDLCQVVY